MMKRLFLMLVLVFAGSTLFAFDRGDCQEIVENGEEKVLEGTLDSRDGNTILKVGKDEYEVLVGPGMFSYKDGDKIKLEGLVYEMKIMPTKVIIGGVEIELGRRNGRRCTNPDSDDRNDFRGGRGMRSGGRGPKGR